jgi:transcriptional regulator with XRE-family HTH domain
VAGVSTALAPHPGVVLREWRVRRRMSQLDVSGRTGVSTRHLSCVETGRSKASRELLLYLSQEFDMPQRATNEMLLAAGFAPVYSDLDLSDSAMGSVREVIALVLAGNDPNPTTVIDSRWNLVDANAAAFWLCREVDPALLAAPNVARLSLHPDGLARNATNLDEFAAQLLWHMRHVHAGTHDPVLAALIEECEQYVPRAARQVPVAGDVVLPVRLRFDDTEVAFLSTTTTFTAAHDVNLSELAIETLYPADEETQRLLAGRPWLPG